MRVDIRPSKKTRSWISMACRSHERAQEGIFGDRLRARLDREGMVGLLDGEYGQPGREQVLLPGVWPDSVAEVRSIVAGLEP